MSFLLDTDIGSAYPKKNQRVIRKVMLHFGGLHLSVIREGELLAKARRASATATRMKGYVIFGLRRRSLLSTLWLAKSSARQSLHVKQVDRHDVLWNVVQATRGL